MNVLTGLLCLSNIKPPRYTVLLSASDHLLLTSFSQPLQGFLIFGGACDISEVPQIRAKARHVTSSQHASGQSPLQSVCVERHREGPCKTICAVAISPVQVVFRRKKSTRTPQVARQIKIQRFRPRDSPKKNPLWNPVRTGLKSDYFLSFCTVKWQCS